MSLTLNIVRLQNILYYFALITFNPNFQLTLLWEYILCKVISCNIFDFLIKGDIFLQNGHFKTQHPTYPLNLHFKYKKVM